MLFRIMLVIVWLTCLVGYTTEFTIMNRQQIAFAINLLHLDIDMAQQAEAVVDLLDDMHRALCSWPFGLTNTEWWDGRKGLIRFTSNTTMEGYTVTTTFANVPPFTKWECHSTQKLSTDGYFSLKSSASAVLFNGGTWYLYLCLKLTAIKDASFRYYIRNPKQTASLSYNRVSTENVTFPLAYNSICLEDSHPNLPLASEYGVWIKKGQEVNAKIACPYALLGTYAFDYRNDATGASSSCTGKALDTCTVNTEMRFNYSGCDPNLTALSFSASNTVWCVDNVLYNNFYYVTTFNGNDADATIDNVTTLRYSCFALSTDGSADQVFDSFCGNNPDNIFLNRTSASPCPSCPILTAPANGAVTYKTDGAVTNAIFTCSSQFSLAGPAFRTCQANFTWSDQNPTCTCIAPSSFANGSVSLSSDGTTLSYTCKADFVLVGNQTRTCTGSNSWSGTLPTCTACVTISAAPGLFTNLTSNGLTTVAYFTCTVGYTLTGSALSTCQTSGSWSTVAATCVACQTLTISGSMTQSMATNGYVSVATFSCKSGYTLSGDVSRTCGTAGTWNGTQSTCNCIDSSPPINGTMTRNGTFAYFRCNAGFIMTGSAVSECLANGTGWSSPTPTCYACSVLSNVIGGNYTLSSNGTTTTATYTCSTGYTISGVTSLICQSSAIWSSSPPTCVKCSNLTNIASGNITYNTNGLVTSAQYACAGGYDLKGNGTTVCKTDGTWSSGAPECLCNNVTAPANGGIFSQDGKAVTYSCNLNYSISSAALGYRSCNPDGSGWTGSDPTCVLCAPLSPVTNATYTLSTSSNLITQATFSCNVGWSMFGNENTKCQGDGSWSPASSSLDYPSCVACPLVVTPSSGHVTLSSAGGKATVATYTCATGYTLIGVNASTCIANTKTSTYWNYPSGGTCKCSTPTKPANGNVTADGAEVTFTCDSGYSMNGSSSGVCGSNGTGWSIATPACIQCPALQSVSSGSVSYTTDGVKTSAIFSCSTGSTLNGPVNIICNAGVWQQAAPNCVSCPPLPTVSITTGNVTLKSNGTTTTAHYNCPPYYKLKGQSTLTCGSNGLWDEVASDCVCDTPSGVVGGQFIVADDGLSVKYSCQAGYSMVGTANVVCDANGTGWKTTFPNCTNCVNLPSPANGSISFASNGTHTSAQYLCGVGFTLSGGDTPTCKPDGTWTTSTQPVCKKCAALPEVSVSTGHVTLATNGSVTIATYTCPTGYKVKGSSVLTCGSDGTWNQPSGSDCVCDDPSLPVGGNYTISDDGLSVTFRCSAGYTMVGTQTVNCARNGTGYLSTPPTCTKCENLPPPTSGNVRVVTDGTQTSAVYSCDVGATLVGEATPTCLGNGTWTNTKPSCVSCPGLKNISVSNGSVTLGTDGKTTTATYVCPYNYVVNGDAALTCQPDGTWSAGESECVSCAILPPVSISTGNVTLLSNGTSTIATYYCPRNYVVKGKTALTCGPDGKWDSVEPSDCVCETPSDIFGGNFSLADNGLSVIFACGTGYSMIGSPVVECDTQGNGWTKTFPNCKKCVDLANPSNGSIMLSTNGTMTTAQYLCGVGSTLSGGETPSCQLDGTWLTTTQPVCETCSVLLPVSVKTGNFTLSTNGSVTIATYNCPSGYKVKGSSVLTCGSGGTWGQPTGSDCVCSDPPLPVGGNYTVSEDGMSVSFACSPGYTMVGPQSIGCDKNGTGYLSSYPSCIKCNDLASPTFGHVNIVTDGRQTSAVYSCNVGATLVGEATPSCLGNGTWTNAQPTCVSCPVLKNITVPSGGITLKTDGKTTIATYTCPDNYVVSGETTLTCQPNGTWNAEESECVSCESLPRVSISTGNVTIVSNGTSTSATYHCPPNYVVKGKTTFTCGPDGKWDASEPSDCVCKPPTSVVGRDIDLADDGLSANFSCGAGYTMVGTSTIECDKNGNGWTLAFPNCTACGALPNPKNGSIALSTNGTMTTAQYLCGVGSTLSGGETPSCLSDGTWLTTTQPVCEKCVDLPRVSVTTGNFTLSTNGSVTIATYNCPSGYKVKGSSVLMCGSGGTWDQPTGSDCVCEDPPRPVGRNYTISDDGLSVTFACSVGYSMVGRPTVTCSTTGAGYLTSYPNCTKCEDLAPPTTGNVHIITDGTQTSAVYTCDVGATLVGEATPSCLGNGTWTNARPTCVSCPGLKNISIPNGSLTLTTNGRTTIATYTCPDNYVVNGDTTLTCQPDGTWSAKESRCVSCEDLPPVSISTGNVTIESNGTSTIAKYFCPPNYTVKGKDTLTCGPDGKWNAPEPSDCVCDTPSVLTGVSFVVSDNGLAVIFACDTGYTMVGTPEIKCDTGGTGWTKSFPNCTKCETIEGPKNGTISLVTNGTHSSAQYICLVGHTLSGAETPTCQPDGTWSKSTTPVCKKCLGLPTLSISNGNISYSTNGSVTVATYNCPNGYAVKGSTVLTCGPDGTWDQPNSDCVCTSPPLPDGGSYTVASDGLSVTFKCDTGYTMVGQPTIVCDTNGAGYTASFPSCAKCEDLLPPNYGNIDYNTDGKQTIATFSCDIGGTLVGVASPKCLPNGTWTSSPPTCVTCPALDAVSISTGMINVTSDGRTTTATYVCPARYVVKGSPIINCLGNGSWSYSQSDCVCEAPQALAGRNFELSADGLGVQFTCAAGYTMVGVSSVACDTDGHGWAITHPNCTKCADLEIPNSGNIKYTTNGTTSFVEYTCGVGYTMLGQNGRRCLDDGSWSSTGTPTCVSCSTLPNVTISNGNVMLTTNGSTTVATYTCPVGYVVQGDATLTCRNDGRWSANPSDCVCAPPLLPPHGDVNVSSDGLTATFSCGSGFTMAGRQSVECLKDGTGWRFESPNCTKCESVSNPSSGHVVLETNGTTTQAVYSCDLGSTLVGDANIRCLGGGSWTSLTPKCESCSAVPVGANRNYSTTTNGTHTTINFTCGLGTTMLGSPVSTCLSATKWSSSNPQCVSCESVTNGNGPVVLSTDGLKTTAKISCTTGYHLDTGGTDTVVECGTDGKWKSLSKCICDDPPSINNGAVSANGLVATYSCKVQFALMGIRNRACGSNGHGWVGFEPTCNACNALMALVNGDTKFSTNGTVTIASFTCNIGSTLSGNSTAICIEDGTWSIRVPTCVTCPPLTNSTNGQYKMSSDGTVTSVTLVCNEGYQASGAASMMCMSDGKWNWQFDQISKCELTEKDNSQSTSYLEALIAVSVVSIAIIAVLSIILAWFVRRYMTSMRSDKSKYTFDGSHRNDAVKDFPALERATTSIAPVNHQHHVLEKGGMLATSPAPSAFKKPTKQNFSETPREADIETHRSGDSIISFRRTKTSMTDKSVNSINSVEIIEPPRTPNPNRLVPIDDKKSLVGRIPNKSPKLNGKVPYLDLNGHHTPVRSNTPVNHGMRVSDSDRSSRSVSTVDN